MNLIAKYISDSLNKGVAVDLDAQDWQKITEGWKFDLMQDIICNIDTPENIKKVMDCLLSLSAKGAIEPPDSFLNECWGWCTFHSAVLESQQPAEPAEEQTAEPAEEQPAEPTEEQTAEPENNTFSIPQYLQSYKAQKMLKALEETNGYNDKPVLDRSNTPWGYSSQPDWGFAAKTIVEKLGVTMHWKDWAGLIGKDPKKLQKAYNKSSQSTDSKNKITNALKSIK